MSQELRVAILGAGNMGGALLGGILKAGVVDKDHVVATVRSEGKADALRAKYGCDVLAGGNRAAAEGAALIVLATKPHIVPKVVDEIAPVLKKEQILVSLAAALPLAVIEKRLLAAMPCFRAMPNIPVVVEEGAVAICGNAHARPEHHLVVERMFRAVGIVCTVEEEMMDAVTALSGSGPAYVYMVIEAFIAGGVKMGLSREASTRLAEQTVLGAAKHVRESMLHPAILRDEVTTPGGTTIVAIHELERHGLRSMLISAIETATRHAKERSKALAQKLDQDQPPAAKPG
ncbi:MAG: pyrroline-5-carboxylate reductase [Bryobacterales bacterium]|nr:pyrroline-5-carboxylate reductase [Bryobacterales bacterium]